MKKLLKNHKKWLAIILAFSMVLGISSVPISAHNNLRVYYHANGATSGTAPVDNNNYRNNDIVQIKGNTGSLAKSGYAFANWNTSANGTGNTFAPGSYGRLGNRDANLYAQYTPINQTLVYNANGGTGSMSDSVKLTGTVFGLKANAFTRTGYDFAGWSTTTDGAVSYANQASFTMPAGGDILYAIWNIRSYTVTFKDWDDSTLQSGSVNYGHGATAPADPLRTGFTFTGWDKGFNNITADLTVNAVYTINSYTVVFKDWDGTSLKTESVDHGNGATAPADPSRIGYDFIGWDVAFDSITGDLTVNAEYGIQQFVVTFVDYDGVVIDTQTVDYGSSATEPADPDNQLNYHFTNWDKAFNNVMSDLTVTAIYAIDTFTVTFVDHDDAVLDTQTVDYGFPASAPSDPDNKENFHFAGWDVAFDNITANLTVKAMYAIDTFTVTFVDYDFALLDTQTVDYGSPAAAPSDPDNQPNYHFTGWDVAFDSITSNLTVQAIYAIDTFTVTFVDYDDSFLAEQTVQHGSGATAPADPDNQTNYHFTGWDVSFSNITGNLTVTALYAIDQFEVTFKTFDGTVIGTQTVDYGTAAIAPPENPSRPDFDFAGWDVSFANITEDLIVTAIFLPVEELPLVQPTPTPEVVIPNEQVPLADTGEGTNGALLGGIALIAMGMAGVTLILNRRKEMETAVQE